MSTQPQPVGILGSLFDFSFSNFITGKLIPILYGLGLIACGIAALSMLATGFAGGFTTGLVALLLAPIVFLFVAMYLRVMLEVLIVVFRIAENVQRIADRPAA